VPNWLVTREQVKRAARQYGATAIPDSRNRVIDQMCESSSRSVERAAHRFYIPRVQTKLYRWPQWNRGYTWQLLLDQDLLSVSALLSAAQDATPTTITSYFLEPQSSGPPYGIIEVDLASSDYFAAGNTPQRSISVSGTWGYSDDTQSAGTVASGLASSATATTFVCSDASKIDVGDTLVIGTEQLFVSERSAVTTTTALNGALAATKSVVAVPVADGTTVNAGEVILVDSERMFVREITANVLTVDRDWDGTILASHLNSATVYAYRTLTVERGVNGTTAAIHANDVAISRYVPYGEAGRLALADAISNLAQTDAAFGRAIGQGDGAREYTGVGIKELWAQFMANGNRRARFGTI